VYFTQTRTRMSSRYENNGKFWRSVAAIRKQIWCCPCVYKKKEQRERGGEIGTIGKLVWKKKDSTLESVHWEYDFLPLHPLNHCLDDPDDDEACS
jgi:hypothetical protein